MIMIKPSDFDVLLESVYNSNKKIYRIEYRDLGDSTIFNPRIPEYLKDTKIDIIKNRQNNGLFEDYLTPRICFSETINGCLNAIVTPSHDFSVYKWSGEKDWFKPPKDLFVYTIEKPITEYKYITNEDLNISNKVFDSEGTKELWILEPVKIIKCGIITFYGKQSVKYGKIKHTHNGHKTFGYFGYAWEWKERY